MPRERRTFTAEFKRQMVQLYENGKTRAAIVKEYELIPSALDRWINRRTPRVPLLRKIIERQKKLNSLHFVKNLSNSEWRMTFERKPH